MLKALVPLAKKVPGGKLGLLALVVGVTFASLAFRKRVKVGDRVIAEIEVDGAFYHLPFNIVGRSGDTVQANLTDRTGLPVATKIPDVIPLPVSKVVQNLTPHIL